ncbi:MAG: helix-turn-helix transcriptional regulator [Proteobacteria bacterium]|nr:helix-turn-helix transcriptional regulator [Pseudomonadota bacterium]
MPGIDPQALLKWLRAAGEASRLRLLALCMAGELSVSDLAQAVGQSEPRVSRHLKILGEAGLIERVRQGQWVHYHVAPGPAPTAFVRGLLAQLDRQDPVLLTDRQAAELARVQQGAGAAGPSRLGRALAGFLAEMMPRGATSGTVLAGVAHPELLTAAAGATDACIAVAHSRRAAQAARAQARTAGLRCRVLEGAAATALDPAALGPAGPVDLVVLDLPQADAARLERLLGAARRLLGPSGSIAVFSRYDALEAPRARVVEHPLARLRRLLGEARFTCMKLSPIEADGQHVLAAFAVAASAPATRTAEAS